MKLLRVEADPALSNGTVAVIGNFDGVHLGHQTILTAVRAAATQADVPMLVILFEPQTREFFLKDQSPPRLSSLRNKLHIFKQFGVDLVRCLRFNHRIASMSAADFAKVVIFSQLKVKHLFVGNDFRFGCDRLGDAGLLHTLASAYHAQISVYPDVAVDQDRVSSTRIRQLLQRGHLQDAQRLLGRPYTLCGRVIHGEKQARIWGVPTANLALNRGPLPLNGVFLVNVITQAGETLQGIANLGCRPTVCGSKNLLEIHLLNFSGWLYGEFLEVIFLDKLRDEKKFTSKDALIIQIHADVAAAQTYFTQRALL